jgi:hypothetical protein
LHRAISIRREDARVRIRGGVKADHEGVSACTIDVLRCTVCSVCELYQNASWRLNEHVVVVHVEGIVEMNHAFWIIRCDGALDGLREIDLVDSTDSVPARNQTCEILRMVFSVKI